MRTARLETNLKNYELEEVLEKALKSIRQKTKPLDDPFVNSLAEEWNRIFSVQLDHMMNRINKVITEGHA